MPQCKLNYYSAVILSLCSIVINVDVAEAVTLDDKVFSCSKIKDNQARLSCFDALTLKKAGAADCINPTKQFIDDFSKNHINKTQKELDNEIKTITLTIQRLSKNPYGKWIINFENGQKWQQKDSTTLNLKIGQHVLLTKGVLSAVYLQKEDGKKRIQVHRLK